MNKNEYAEQVRNYIFEELLESNKTQNQFAADHGIDRSNLSKILRGTKMIKPESLAIHFPEIVKKHFPDIKLDDVLTKKTKTKTAICQYNEYVDCDEQDKCDKCGWNPVVMEARIKNIENSTEGTVTQYKLLS